MKTRLILGWIALALLIMSASGAYAVGAADGQLADVSTAGGQIDSPSVASPANTPPIITNCPTFEQKALFCKPLVIDFNSSDPDSGDTGHWTVELYSPPVPVGPYSVDSLTGLFSFAPVIQDGGHAFVFRTTVTDSAGAADSCIVVVEMIGWIPYDANCDLYVDISDVVYIVEYIFAGGPPPYIYAADVNHDGLVDISDAVALIAYIFGGGK